MSSPRPGPYGQPPVFVPQRRSYLRPLLAGCGAVLLGVTVGLLGTLLTLRRAPVEWRWIVGGAQAITAAPTWSDGLGLLAAGDGTLTAIDANSGRTLWCHPLGFPVSCPVVCSAGRAWVADEAGRLLGLNLVSGRQEVKVGLGSAAVGQSVAAGLIVTATDDRRLVALRALDGGLQWECQLPDIPCQPPLVVAAGRLILVPSRHGLILVDPARGQVRASFLDDNLWGRAQPVPEGVWRGNDRGELHLLQPGSDDLTWHSGRQVTLAASVVAAPWAEDGTLLAGTVQGDAYCIDAASGRIRWHTQARGRLVAQPVLSGDLTLWGTVDGWLEARSLGNGELRWRVPAAGRVGTDLQTAHGYVYCSTWGGICGALSLASPAGRY